MFEITHKQKINQYLDILQIWNEKYLLIGKSMTADKIIDQSWIVLQELRANLDLQDAMVIDVGSGAGLPGILWSIWDVKNIFLIEQREKRVTFLKYCIKQLSLDATAVMSDIRKYTLPHTAEKLVITAQAFAPVVQLIDYTKHLFVPNTFLVLLKQYNVMDEIDIALQKYTFEYSVKDCEFGKLVFIKNIIVK